MKTIRTLISAALLASLPGIVSAEVPAKLREVAQQAVSANPEVQARWHAFEAARHEQDVVRSGYLPQIDVAAGVGREKIKLPGATSDSFDRTSTSVIMSQMLFDGFLTRSEVSRFGHAKMVRYQELLSDAESVALEAVRAYVDVQRQRELVRFAQENYVEHKLVYDQIVDRTRSGIGRGVDLELATGRLALAESNLLTAATNLHDVSTRYLRVVGTPPVDDLPALDPATLRKALPANVRDALREAYSSSPSLKATVANVRAGEMLVDSRRAANSPRIDLLARQDYDRQLDGGRASTREGVVEVVMSYNLYRGGADQARLRQAAEELNGARDTREKVCRDIRQTLTIAYNDVSALESQLRYLDQHQLSMSKARQAFRQQFDIGQRTLLDLLDNENEYFDSRRAYAEAAYNQLIAQARSLAGMGQLLKALSVTRDNLPAFGDLAGNETYLEPEAVCPPDAPEMVEIDKPALLEEAMRTVGSARR